LFDQFSEPESLVEFTHQDQAAVGSDARTLEADLERSINEEISDRCLASLLPAPSMLPSRGDIKGHPLPLQGRFGGMMTGKPETASLKMTSVHVPQLFEEESRREVPAVAHNCSSWAQ
jgi:hypothetical protein